ncbi:hypothetical protein XELAEV_18024780mg [Pelobates cultripes]|uniref:CCHC-type domain-containing protein n=1 Tax=Pelobates cultripes TaxID=61616 RepID=A0AAD1STH2_PELCU|nr:hypothetical protein XELAEV_18024780mg [Pelobates cultripes]
MGNTRSVPGAGESRAKTAIEIVRQMHGKTAVKGIGSMLKKAGMTPSGSLDLDAWQKFKKDCKGWLKDKGLSQKANIWEETARMILQRGCRETTRKGIPYYECYDVETKSEENPNAVIVQPVPPPPYHPAPTHALPLPEKNSNAVIVQPVPPPPYPPAPTHTVPPQEKNSNAVIVQPVPPPPYPPAPTHAPPPPEENPNAVIVQPVPPPPYPPAPTHAPPPPTNAGHCPDGGSICPISGFANPWCVDSYRSCDYHKPLDKPDERKFYSVLNFPIQIGVMPPHLTPVPAMPDLQPEMDRPLGAIRWVAAMPPPQVTPLPSCTAARGQTQYSYTERKPWSPSEQLAMIMQMPNPADSPVEFARFTDTIQRTWNCSWVDLESLVRAKAGPVISFLIAQVTDDTRKRLMRSGTVDGEWFIENENSGKRYTKAIDKWARDKQEELSLNLMDVTQEKGESVDKFFARLQLLWKGIGYIAEDSRGQKLLGESFVNGLHPPLSTALKVARPEWRSLLPTTLVIIVKAFEAEMQKNKVVRNMRSQRRGGTGRGRGRGRYQSGTQRNAPICWNCGWVGHIKRDCMYLPQQQQHQGNNHEYRANTYAEEY